MEASGAGGIGMAPCVPNRCRSSYVRGRERGRGWVGLDYKDKAHVDYYSNNVNVINNKAGGVGENNKKDSSKKREKEKEKLKSIRKALSKDLSTLTHIYPHQPSLSEAAHVLMKHLEQLRTEEEEEEKEKEQLLANLPTAEKTMKPSMDCESSSESSESSESSDSECEDMMPKSCSTATQTVAIAVAPTVPQVIGTLPTPPPLPLQPQVPKPLESPGSCTEDCSNTTAQAIGETSSDKRIEVCMGGKCKKSGGVALLEEFEKLMGGVQGAVVGSKCMGKCKESPNVRLRTSTPAIGLDDSVRTTPPNPICGGVGLEDVSLIVANFFGQDGLDVGLAS